MRQSNKSCKAQFFRQIFFHSLNLPFFVWKHYTWIQYVVNITLKIIKHHFPVRTLVLSPSQSTLRIKLKCRNENYNKLSLEHMKHFCRNLDRSQARYLWAFQLFWNLTILKVWSCELGYPQKFHLYLQNIAQCAIIVQQQPQP